MALLRLLLFLVILTSTCFGHSMPGRKEDAHYDKDGKHNDEYDQESFLGHNGQEEFGNLDNQERVFQLA